MANEELIRHLMKFDEAEDIADHLTGEDHAMKARDLKDLNDKELDQLHGQDHRVLYRGDER